MKIPRRRLKHPKCPSCRCLEDEPKVIRYSDWRIGGVIYCRKKKTGEEYNSTFSELTYDVMRFLHHNPASTDRELTFGLGTSHAAMVRRMELHQAGVVDAVGEVAVGRRMHTLWALNEEGERIWASLNAS